MPASMRLYEGKRYPDVDDGSTKQTFLPAKSSMLEMSLSAGTIACEK